jgi:hypothetical protein
MNELNFTLYSITDNTHTEKPFHVIERLKLIKDTRDNPSSELLISLIIDHLDIINIKHKKHLIIKVHIETRLFLTWN